MEVLRVVWFSFAGEFWSSACILQMSAARCNRHEILTASLIVSLKPVYEALQCFEF